MALYNTVPAEDTRLQAPKSWKLKKIVVVSAALSFSLGACAATALSYREVGASRATQLVAQTDCQAKYPNLCSRVTAAKTGFTATPSPTPPPKGNKQD